MLILLWATPPLKVFEGQPDYFGRFAEICQTNVGWTYDFTAVGNVLGHCVRDGARWSRRDVSRSQVRAMARPDNHRGDLMECDPEKRGGSCFQGELF